MNKQRRKAIADIMAQIDDLHSKIEKLRDEEQEAYDNLPEGLQEGAKGDSMYEAIDNLDSALGSLEEANDYLNTASE